MHFFIRLAGIAENLIFDNMNTPLTALMFIIIGTPISTMS